MKNLRIFYYANKEYIFLFSFLFIVLNLFGYAFSLDFRIYFYTILFIFSFILPIQTYWFFKLKKAMKDTNFAFFRNDIYEKHIESIYKAKEQELQSTILSGKLNQDELESLLTIWTHQIKTPISAISLISERYMDTDIKAELIRIDDYISSLLSFIKLRQNTLDYSFKSVSINRLVKDIVKRYRCFFIAKKLAVQLEIEDENILTDSKWLGLVIEQVLFNAIKYTETGYIRIQYSNHILRIEDTGIGIKAEDLQNIKKLGFSGDTIKRDASSTGIGLYIVDKILVKLNYSYNIESTWGKGTVFTINLDRKAIICD